MHFQEPSTWKGGTRLSVDRSNVTIGSTCDGAGVTNVTQQTSGLRRTTAATMPRIATRDQSVTNPEKSSPGAGLLARG
jgi:hypothetical protein